MRQHEGGDAGVDDRAAMRAAVAEPEKRARISQHFAHRRVVAVGVVDDREEQEPVEPLDQVIIDDLLRAQIAARGNRRDALLRRRLVIGCGTGHDVHAVPAAHHVLPRLGQPGELGLRRLLREKLPAHLGVAHAVQPLLRQQRVQRDIARADREGVERAGDAHDQPDRAAGDLGGNLRPLRPRGVNTLHQPLPARGIPSAVGQEEPDRPAGFLRQPRHPGELGVFIDKIAVHAEGAAAHRGHRLADAVKLSLLGEMTGDEVARIGFMRIGARGCKAERAGAQRLLRQPAHLGDVLRGRGFATDAAVAHHEHPKRVVRNLRADVDRARDAVERVEVLGKAFPIPFEALGESSARNVLDRLHQVDQASAMLAADRREANTAIAE